MYDVRLDAPVTSLLVDEKLAHANTVAHSRLEMKAGGNMKQASVFL